MNFEDACWNAVPFIAALSAVTSDKTARIPISLGVMMRARIAKVNA